MTFTQIVNNARQLNLKNQGVGVRHQLQQALGNVVFVLEYQTLRIDIGRQVGKTSYVFQNAGPLDLVIVPTIQHAAWHRIQQPDNPPQIWSQHQATRDNFTRGKYLTFRDVYVDDCPELDLEKLCSVVTINNQLIVFGG